MIIYDCEIKRMMPDDNEPDPALEYCNGWSDFTGMGISVICAYDFQVGLYRVFMDDNLPNFQRLINETDAVIGWGNQRFDDLLVSAFGIDLPTEKSFDLKAIVMQAAGLDPKIGAHHHGLSLDKMAKANLDSTGKSGHGSNAPRLWQQGKLGALTDYCLGDVGLTKDLLVQAMSTGCLRTPDGKTLGLELPRVMMRAMMRAIA